MFSKSVYSKLSDQEKIEFFENSKPYELKQYLKQSDVKKASTFRLAIANSSNPKVLETLVSMGAEPFKDPKLVVDLISWGKFASNFSMFVGSEVKWSDETVFQVLSTITCN